MSLESYSARDRRVMAQIGRLETIETYFDWRQLHLSEFQEGRRA